MTPPLTLIIPPDWPQHRRDCPWALLDATGHVAQRGCSEPKDWPSGDGEGPQPCQLLLTGHQLAGQRARLPAGQGGRRREVVGSVLEESLLDAPEQLSFAVGETATDSGLTPIGIISRARLTALVKLLRELGWSPQAAWPLGMAADAPSAWLCGEEINLIGPEGYIATSINESLIAWLAVTQAPTLPLTSLDDNPERDRHLQSLIGDQVVTAQRLPQLRLPPGTGFLDGDLAPPRQATPIGRHFRPALRLAAGFAIALGLMIGAQWSWNALQLRSLHQQIAIHFRTVLPQTPLVDPLRQMEQALASARRNNGQLSDSDFLMLAATLGEMPETAQLRELVYENERLRGVAVLPESVVETLAAAAAKRNQVLHATRQGENVEFTLAPGGRQ